MAEFVIPDRFNRNSPDVRALATPAITGKVLLDYMAARLRLGKPCGKAVLDIGCGSRFASTIRTYDIPVGYYMGVDVDPEMISWLQQHAALPKMSFHCVDQRNPMYNPTGAVTRRTGRLPPAWQQLARLLSDAGWAIVSEAPPNPPFENTPIILPIRTASPAESWPDASTLPDPAYCPLPPSARIPGDLSFPNREG